MTTALKGMALKTTYSTPLVFGLLCLTPAASSDMGHRLPSGPERAVREREVDIGRVAIDLRLDLDKETVEGSVSIRFTPLRHGLTALSMDAAGIDVKDVELVGTTGPLAFAVKDRALRITLPRPLNPDAAGELRISYSARPRSGLYFQPRAGKKGPVVWNYGEGGRHYGWVPLYNAPNDRFSVEMRLTVARPYEALANGVLKETRENADGTRTFVWVQEEPIPNYLFALDAGEFARVDLGAARVEGRAVPLAAYAAPGLEGGAAYAFRNTAKMVEYFSERFGYPYPWPKYDQIALREFAIGAMETTGLVGFSESHLHVAGDPPDSGPDFDQGFPIWTYEDTISHELAHHWFGDLVTCRSVGSIFLNESFASFSHTLWNEHANGADDGVYQRWRYLDAYLEYVRKTGEVRPLQYFRYESSGDMYQQETTYIKGALVLQSLRHVLGDDDFFRGLRDYLKRHEYSEVEATELQSSLERASGRSLAAFFGDWIVGGGGHPVFQVAQRYSPRRKAVDLTIRQVQADQPFENSFTLPVDVEVATASGTKVHRVDVSGWTTRVSLPADAPPLYVAFDKGGWLVADVSHERPLSEVLAQLARGGVAEKLRAARQLAEDNPRSAPAVGALAAVLADPREFWGVRQEAARGLGAMAGETAVAALQKALRDSDARVRRSAALALGEAGGRGTAEALRAAVEKDKAEDVAAVAAHALGRLGAPGAAEFLKAQLPRESRWWESVRLGALLGLAELEDPALVPVFRPYVETTHTAEVRLAALDGWSRAAPADEALAARLRGLVHDRTSNVRAAAIGKLGEMHREEDLAFLRDFAAEEPDNDLAAAARAAVEGIEAFVKKEGAE
jgi:aminopeptidase N